jgi:fatty-acyl-CoA synthase
VAGAPPAPAVLAKMTTIGIELTHVYGLTETYGPASVCVAQESWKTLPEDEQARLVARQGVRYHLQARLSVRDPATLEPVPSDGATVGELMFRGNICMKGYLKNESATEEAFRGGWFHTGDLGMMMPDGYARITDRSKDIIISGGENISSIEVEDTLYRHPAVALAAVVAMPDPKWGEVPCAFVQLRPGASATAEEIIAHCRLSLARFKVPRVVKFGELPRTATGKLQKYALREQIGSKDAIDFSGASGSAVD